MRESIVQEIKEAKFFSVLCDGVADNANLEQLSFVFRVVDQDCQIREECLDFQCTDRITGLFVA